MKVNFKPIIIFGVMLFSAHAPFLFLGCGNEEKANAKSMEQIRAEEGVPVKIDILKTQPFRKYSSFFAKLSGIKESTKGAMVGGKIEKINAQVGSYVKKNQVIMEFAEDNPGLQYEQAKNAFDNAEKTYQRMKALLEAGQTAQANYDGAETNYLVAKRNYESLKQMLFVESPIDGIVVDIKVREGDNVKGDTHLFTVAQLHKMQTKIWASESEVRDIKKGMKAETEFNGEKFMGKVTEVAMAADPYKQAFYAELEFDNSKKELFSGVTQEIRILTYENNNAIVIPRNIVMNDEKGTYVFVDDKGNARKRYITNGNDSGINYEVLKGLNKGDRIIVEGISLLDDGAKIKLIQ